MFKSIPQLLTLAAFTVHAVLGCCWHHEHHLGDGSCQHPAGQTLADCGTHRDSQESLPALAAVDTQAHLDLQSCHQHGHAPQRQLRLSQQDQAHCQLSAAGDSAHDCGGMDCTYARIGSAGVSPAVTQTLNWLAQWTGGREPFSGLGLPAGSHWLEPGADSFSTAAQARAVLQSWQI